MTEGHDVTANQSNDGSGVNTNNKSGNNNKKDEKYISTIFYWISGFSFLFSLIAICGAFFYKNTVLTNESIVLIFVGILATFVVVSNYIQVKSIEDRTEKQINSLQVQIDEFENKLDDIFISQGQADYITFKINRKDIVKKYIEKYLESNSIKTEEIFTHKTELFTYLKSQNEVKSACGNNQFMI
ncbi:MAG: hypothetical protein LBT56_03610, partial [Prevotellaceae bacterium]|nr:hypothetical protein [Prevotellaceae bacterium]